MREVPEVPGVMTAGQVVATARYHRRAPAPRRDDPVVPGRALRPLEPRRGGHGPDRGRHGRRGRSGLPVAGRHPAPRRQLVQLLPGHRRRRTPGSTPTSAPTWPPGRGTTTCRPASSTVLEDLWPVVEAGVDFVLRWQRPDGSIRWSLDPVGVPRGVRPRSPARRRSTTASAAPSPVPSVSGHERPDWELAAGRLAHAMAHQPEAFAPKEEFAMDWYYPVLAGRLSGEAAHARMDAAVGHVRHGRPRGALRVDRRVGHRGGDRRVRAGPRRPRTGRGRPRPAHLGPGAAQRGRLLLDRDGLPRGGDVPSPRALDLHRRGHRPGRRRPQPDHPGLGDLPRGGAAQPPRPHRAAPESPVEPAVRAPGSSGAL